MEESRVIHIGVIGCGVIGHRLIEVFQAHKKLAIAAVCDVSAERAQETAEKFDVSRWYTDYRELLATEDIELVYVAVPPAFHHRIALDVIAAGKHIFCEKPLANSREEAQEMLAAAKQAGVVHAMNFPTFYRPNFKRFQELLAEGYLGEVRRIELVTHFQQWPRPWQNIPWIGGREQGGFVREVVPHYLQLLNHLYGPIQRVRSELQFPQDEQLCETGLIAQLQLHDGTPVVINGLTNVAQKEHLSLTFYGTEGTLAIVNWTELHGGKAGELPSPLPVSAVESSHANTHLLEMVGEIVRAIDGATDARLCDFQVGYDVQVLLEALRHPGDDNWHVIS